MHKLENLDFMQKNNFLLIKISRVMKYDTTTIKSNVRFFLYGIVLSLYVDSKIILQERLCENGKLQKLDPSRNENST